jgi:hypothetical protein
MIRILILKLFSLFVYIKFPSLGKEYRYYLRDNLYSKFRQSKYFLKDFILKKKYKTVEWKGEFQAEITHALPFAYWHHLNGTLKKTVSCKGTRELYFFSEDHEERYTFRDWNYNFNNNFEFPNMTHSYSKSFKKWKAVPLKTKYQNLNFSYDKPILVIANKYNIEWDRQPSNYFDMLTLEKIIQACRTNYQIIYNRPLPLHITEDNSEILDLDEHGWLKRTYPEVLQLNDIYESHKNDVNSFNHLQLLLYSNCGHFISVHGGTGTLASYFGGTNIILSNGGLESRFNEYENFFPLLSGARILHAKSQEEVLDLVFSNYL